MTLEAVLVTGWAGPVLIVGGIPRSAADLRSRALPLAEALRSGGHRRVMVVSNQVVDVLLGLCAAEIAACPVYLVSYSVERHAADDLSRVQGISATIDGEELRELGGHRPAPRTSEGFRIYLMTSGTTGAPKIAEHTYDRLLGRVRVGTREGEPQTWLLTYQPTSFAGLQVMLTALLNRSTLVSASAGTPAAMVAEMIAHRVSHVSGTPSFWRAALMCLRPGDDLGHLRQITVGGEAIDQASLDRLGRAFPRARIVHIYASTEAGAVFAVHDRKVGFPTAWLRTGVDGAQLRILDGVLQVRSPRSMLRYASADATPIRDDGWLVTGDLVEIVGDRVVFVGRAGRSFNVGGAKVLPEEVEAVLLGVPGVQDVRVTGAPNPITGWVAKAEVVPSPDVDTGELRRRLLQHARSALAPFKVPRVVQFVAAIATEASGKKKRDAYR